MSINPRAPTAQPRSQQSQAVWLWCRDVFSSRERARDTVGEGWPWPLHLQVLTKPIELRVEYRGIPHLAKNERDVGHPISCCRYRNPVIDLPPRTASRSV